MTTPRRALIVVDVQNEYFDADRPLAVAYPPRDESLKRVLAAMDAAQESGVPIVTVAHVWPEEAPVFAEGSEGARLHPDVAARSEAVATHVVKQRSSVLTSEGLPEWLRENAIDTLTLVGYMTNNCVLASAAAAEPEGLAVEVLSDATGAIHLSNAAGSVSAQQVHETLMVLLHSNWAAVAGTDTWIDAVADGRPLEKSDLGSSAVQGRAEH
ncbi:isochorismatase family protein [Tsukamurella pseudospumae]|uniref:Isochorismatase n=1 Tax=Tsukamurella pseudospumae TaxID=239498 RepID=A0A138AVH7_9ACTN|nr:isochorismatase family protein [Tsukamurella pseudospumae]KXO91339.1 isochorismatase [Tsukamurella pseudospumae]KXP14376.1 isochorismatase [Tsukamurella pseudospumae]